MCTILILDTSVDIDTEIEQSEQGTVSIETAFCQCKFCEFHWHHSGF